MRRLLVTLALYILAVYSVAHCEDLPARARLKLDVRPRAQHWIQGRSATVRTVVRILDDGQAFPCPSYEWEWGDGTTSAHGDSCDPYQLQDERPRIYTAERSHRYHYPGDFAVTVVARSQYGAELRASRNVSVYPPWAGGER